MIELYREFEKSILSHLSIAKLEWYNKNDVTNKGYGDAHTPKQNRWNVVSHKEVWASTLCPKEKGGFSYGRYKAGCSRKR